VVERYLKASIDADPSRPEGYINLGYLYEDMENWPAARETFEAERLLIRQILQFVMRG